MNKDETTVLPYLFGATIVTYVSRFAPPQQELTIQPLVGMFILGSVLLIIAIWSPEVATLLALIVFVTSLVINGTRLFGAVSKVGTVPGYQGSTVNPGAGGGFTQPPTAGAGSGGGGFGAR